MGPDDGFLCALRIAISFLFLPLFRFLSIGVLVELPANACSPFFVVASHRACRLCRTLRMALIPRTCVVLVAFVEATDLILPKLCRQGAEQTRCAHRHQQAVTSNASR